MSKFRLVKEGPRQEDVSFVYEIGWNNEQPVLKCSDFESLQQKLDLLEKAGNLKGVYVIKRTQSVQYHSISEGGKDRTWGKNAA